MNFILRHYILPRLYEKPIIEIKLSITKFQRPALAACNVISDKPMIAKGMNIVNANIIMKAVPI
jgi:hypothetical protein